MSQRAIVRTSFRILLPILAISALVTPWYVFFRDRGGLQLFDGMDAGMMSYAMFPLMGLTAFVLVWMQVMIGALRPQLQLAYSGIVTFHRREGIVALTFAFLHPVLLLVGLGIREYLSRSFVAPGLWGYVLVGYAQLALLSVTVASAILMRQPWLQRRWRTVHQLNYGVFMLVWIHSWFLGSDVRTTGLRYLWIVLGVTVIAAAVVRLFRESIRRVRSDDDQYIRIAAVADVREGAPYCLEFRGKQLALFTIGGTIFAIDGICSHASGHLCQGTVDGSVVTCPRHGAKFDVRTGAVVGPPATVPQQKYDIRVRNGEIEIRAS